MKARRYQDGTIEFEVTEQDKNLLVRTTRADIVAALKECVELEKTHIQDSEKRIAASPNMTVTSTKTTKSSRFPERDWMFLLEAFGERKGTHDHARYLLYQHKRTKIVGGLIKSKHQSRVCLLGNPEDSSSIIGQIWRFVESMPFHDTFTRGALAEILPSNLARSENIKFGLLYLMHIGIIAEQEGKKLGTGAKTYVRKKEKRDNTSQESAKELAGAIPR